MKPLLKWPGGKRRIADLISGKLQPYINDNGRYIELFAGGAALFFHMEPKRAVLVDACKPLMAFYEAVRREPDAVVDELEKLLVLPHNEIAFNQIKSEWNGRDFGVKFAAKFLYLNRLGFNGLFRLNKKLGYNVPWGKLEKQPTFPSRQEIVAASTLLKRATLYSRDYYSILRATHRDDVIYADPPYWGTYDKYAGGNFTEDDQIKLANGLRKAVERGANVFASNIDCPAIRNIYDNWAEIDIVPVHHKIGASVDSRKMVDEVLMVSTAPIKNPKQMALFA